MAKTRKPKPKTPAAARKSSRSGEPLNVWIRNDLMAALRQLLALTTPRTSKTALVELALEKLLAERDLWPPANRKGP